jgi:hypothetical protein
MVNYMLTWEENLHDKRDDFNVPIMNFPFICSNIAAAMEYISLSWYDIPEHVVPIVTQWPKEKYKTTDNDPQNIHIKLEIE